MPVPRARLDLLLLPDDPDRLPADEALDRLAVLLDESGVPRWRIDRPGRVTFYANGLGGFTVRCPSCASSVVGPFRKALEAWRSGGPRRFDCPRCQVENALEALHYAPDAAFAQLAVVLADVDGVAIDPDLRDTVEGVLGPTRLLLRRPA